MKKKHAALLRKIYQEVPLEWRKDLMKKRNKYGFMKELMQKGIEDPEFPQEKKDFYQNAIDAGHMDEEEEYMDPDVAKKIDDFIDGRVLEEVEKGNLPKVARTEILKKTRKYARQERTS